jgi:hypothetical protein
VPRNGVTALFQKAGSGLEGAGEACQSVTMVKGVDYNADLGSFDPKSAQFPGPSAALAYLIVTPIGAKA